MTPEQVIITAIVALMTTLGGAYASRRFGLPGLAQQVDDQESKLIAALRERLDLADARAEEAIKKADETERRRRSCEEEISRLRRDLRFTEDELLSLYRSTGTRIPRTLATRRRLRAQEDPDT